MVAVQPKQTHSMHTRDGVRLDADVYFPQGDGPFPVLLMRQPYGRAIASTVVYAPPSWYAAQGYIVVIQDVRGRGTSEGDFCLFASEIEDGADTVRWAANLPNSSGHVGMYGFSYQGMTQLYAAIGLVRDGADGSAAGRLSDTPLKTLSPAMVGYDLYSDWAYEGGAFCLQASWGWAVQLAAETARRQGDAKTYQCLYAARNAPDYDPISGRSPLLTTLAPDSFYHDWLDHPTPDEYWRQLSPCDAFQAVDLPMLHIGGWFDLYMRGTLRLYRDMGDRSQYPQHLWVGPWPHLPWGRHVGSLDFGAQAISAIDQTQIGWFDYFLKGEGLQNPVRPLPNDPVQFFVMGTNHWRSHPTWPRTTILEYHLHSTGLASTQTTSGTLLPPDDAALLASSAHDRLIHDPWRPVPSLGGHAAAPAGPYNQSALSDRTDVLTYTTALLTQAIHVAGTVTVELCCTADTPSFDLCAVLLEVYPDGRSYHVTQGYCRVPQRIAATDDGVDEKEMQVAIALQPTCFEIAKGHALRLNLSAASYPAYAMNAGTGVLPGQGQLLDAQVITVTLYQGSGFRSCVSLPLVSTDAA